MRCYTALFRGSQEERQEQKDNWLQPGKFDVCVTTFEMCSREKGSLRKFKWQYAPIGSRCILILCIFGALQRRPLVAKAVAARSALSALVAAHLWQLQRCRQHRNRNRSNALRRVHAQLCTAVGPTPPTSHARC
jgi:hypothetical protein